MWSKCRIHKKTIKLFDGFSVVVSERFEVLERFEALERFEVLERHEVSKRFDDAKEDR